MSNPVPTIFTNGIRLVMETSISDPPGGPVPINKYVLLRERIKPVFYIGCPFSSHPVFQKNGPEFRHGVAEGVGPVAEGKAECPFELAGGEFVDLEFETLIVGVGEMVFIL